jgi:hypothetical protein
VGKGAARVIEKLGRMVTLEAIAARRVPELKALKVVSRTSR